MSWLRSPHRLDISFKDLFAGLVACLGSEDRAALESRLLSRWADEKNTLVTLSVRSGLDLYLQAKAFAPGTEILVSAISHPDMFAVIKAHGLVPVPVDLDFATAAPTRASLERVLGPSSRVLLVAHLFGGRIDVDEMLAACREHSLELWEDCAQAFGGGYAGHPEAAVSMFSFGPIKTATSLGGAILRVGSSADYQRMQGLQADYPLQSQTVFLMRLWQGGLMCWLGTRPRLYGAVHKALGMLDLNLTEIIRHMGRSFQSGFCLEALRFQPRVSMIRLLDRRLATYDGRIVEERRQTVRRISDHLEQARQPGKKQLNHLHWVFPICVSEPQAAITALRAIGYDAIPGLSNLAACPPPSNRPELAPANAQELIRTALIIPLHPGIPETEACRVADAVERSQQAGSTAQFSEEARS